MTNKEKLLYMRKFTEKYKCGINKYFREMNCLTLQYQYAMLPMREGDLLAGRYYELPLGFSPQASHGVGYYVDRNYLSQLITHTELTAEEQSQAAELLSFWSKENTNTQIFNEYSEAQLKLLTHSGSFESPAVAFALYRLSGAQMDPTKLLKKGILGLAHEIHEKREESPAFYIAAEGALNLIKDVCISYRDQAVEKYKRAVTNKEKKDLEQIAENFNTIAYERPKTFWQALQLSYLFMVMSGTINYGRMDLYLGEYLQNDLLHGIITEEMATELLTNLWSLIIERNKIWDSRIILGGKDRPNIQAADRFAMLAIEVAKNVKDVIPQLTLRCYDGMNEAVYNKALEAIGAGATFPILYNDTVNIPAVRKAFKVCEEFAENYVPFGCGEYVLCNQSLGTPSGTINFLHGLNTVIYDGQENLLEKCNDFESFYKSYLERMSRVIMCLAEQEKLEYDICGREAPFLLYSILFDDCLERGKPILDGGLRHLGGTLETYGNINTSDSLTAIKYMIFDKKSATVPELTNALKHNFVGYEELQKELLSVPKYGNDDEYADSIAVRFHSDICSIISECAEKVGLDSYLPVLINNSMNTTFGLGTGASADGRSANTYMANANNPTGGMDKNGITAMLNSLVKLKVDVHAGSVQNMRFNKEMFTTLIGKTKGLLQTYFDNGGSQTMITVLNRGDLEAALQEPEKYQNLIVRVGGFSARFVELQKEVQQELLSRTLY